MQILGLALDIDGAEVVEGDLVQITQEYNTQYNQRNVEKSYFNVGDIVRVRAIKIQNGKAFAHIHGFGYGHFAAPVDLLRLKHKAITEGVQ